MFTFGNQVIAKDASIPADPDVLAHADVHVTSEKNGGTHMETRGSGLSASMINVDGDNPSPASPFSTISHPTAYKSSPMMDSSCDTHAMCEFVATDVKLGCVPSSVVTGSSSGLDDSLPNIIILL